MRIHDQNKAMKLALDDIQTRLTEILARMDRKTAMPDGDGHLSNMVNWTDIRSDVIQIRNDAVHWESNHG